MSVSAGQAGGGAAMNAAERAPVGVHVAGEPSSWIVRWAHLIAPGGVVLDVAAGGGRHARWLAARGHRVVALERDPVAIAALGRIPDVEAVAADLEDGSPWPLSNDRGFSAVVVTNYLYRPLLPRILAALGPGGVLLYETFARGNESVGKPSNPAFLLAPGELLEAVHDTLRVIAFEDGFTPDPRPAFVQRICAVREAAPVAANGAAESPAPPRYDLAG